MPIQLVTPTSNRNAETLALVQALGGIANTGVQNYLAGQQRRRQEIERQALVDALVNPIPGTGPVALPGSRIAAGGDLRPVATSPGGGLVPIDRAVAANLPAAALTQLVAQRYAPPSAGEGFSLSPGQTRYDASGHQIAAAPSAPEGPLSSAGKIAADLGVDIRTPEGRAAVETVLKAGGTTVNVGNKPIEGSAAAPLITLPGVIAETPQIEDYLFPAGEFDRTHAGLMMAPGPVRDLSGAGGIYSSMVAAVQAKLRRESGALISPEEAEQQMALYLPSPFDTPEAARSKFDRFKREILATLRTSEQGRTGESATPEVPPLAPGGPGPVESMIDRGVSALQGAAQGAAPQAGQAVGPDELGEGEVIRNPQTGETLIVRGGKLVPYY